MLNWLKKNKENTQNSPEVLEEINQGLEKD